MLVLDALIRPAFVLILHDTADQLVILLQELLDGLLIDLRLASQPVWYECHRHSGKPGWKPVRDPGAPRPSPTTTVPYNLRPQQDRRNVLCDWARKSDAQRPSRAPPLGLRRHLLILCVCAVWKANRGAGPGIRS